MPPPLTLPRRAWLLAPLLAPALQPRRAAGQTRLLDARLRPGQPPLRVTLTVAEGPDPAVRIAAHGADPPPGTVMLPARAGGLGRSRVVALAGRDALLVELGAARGTGLSQTLGAVVAMDDAGRLRIVGLETLEAREAETCRSTARLGGAIDPGPRGTLRLSATFHRQAGACPDPGDGAPHREAWTETLRWNGRGALAGEAVPPGAGPVRHALAAARGRLGAALATPVTDLRALPWEESGIAGLVLLGRS